MSGERKMWLDDLRPAPEGWTHVYTVDEAKSFIQAGPITHASLDNDLGEGIPEGRDLALWMAEHNLWPSQHLSIHSANPVAVDYMSGLVDRYGPYNYRSPDRRTFQMR